MSGPCRGSSSGGGGGWSASASAPCTRSQPRSQKAFPSSFAGVCGWVFCAKNWQLHAFSRYVLCDLHINQIQLDELYAVLRAVKEGALRADEAIQRLERSQHWVWSAMEPESKLLLAITVGPRMLAMAQGIVNQVMQDLAPDCLPLFLTDGFKEYGTSMLSHYGHWVLPERQRA